MVFNSVYLIRGKSSSNRFSASLSIYLYSCFVRLIYTFLLFSLSYSLPLSCGNNYYRSFNNPAHEAKKVIWAAILSDMEPFPPPFTTSSPLPLPSSSSSSSSSSFYPSPSPSLSLSPLCLFFFYSFLCFFFLFSIIFLFFLFFSIKCFDLSISSLFYFLSFSIVNVCQSVSVCHMSFFFFSIFFSEFSVKVANFRCVSVFQS